MAPERIGARNEHRLRGYVLGGALEAVGTEEVALGLKKLHGLDTGIDLARYPALSERVATASGRPVSWHKSVVGAGIFTHEAGIHVDGLLKDPENYQGYDPGEVGRTHRMVVGKHSGSKGVQAAFAGMGMLLSSAEARKLLPDIRAFAEKIKRSPADLELLALYQRLGVATKAPCSMLGG